MNFRGKPIAALLLCAALLLGGLTGCAQIGGLVSNVTATGEFPVEINGVTVQARPQKAVVLSPSLADVVLSLGVETQLAAAADTCTQDGLRSLTKLDGTDVQAILDQSPDLILTDGLDESLSAELEGARVTVLTVSPATDREDFERLYAQVSSAFSGGGAGYDDGVRIAQDIFTTLDDINRVAPKDKVTTACYLYDLEDRAVTGDQFGSTIMIYAGVTNVFQSLRGGVYDFESLRISDPTCIFCVPGLAEQLKADERFSGLHAVANDRVYELDSSMLEWQGRASVIGAAIEISGDCFPELLEESSMEVTDPTQRIESEVSSALAATPEPSPEPSPAVTISSYDSLQVGDQSEDVLAMQTMLDRLGYLDVDYDGLFGEYTAACVREFQRVNGLEETGVANEETLRLLFSPEAKPKGE